MKIYRVIDNAICIKVTADELEALRLLRKIMEKYDVTWGWIENETF